MVWPSSLTAWKESTPAYLQPDCPYDFSKDGCILQSPDIPVVACGQYCGAREDGEIGYCKSWHSSCESVPKPIPAPTPATGPTDGVYVLHPVVAGDNCKNIPKAYDGVSLDNIFVLSYQGVRQTEIKPISSDVQCNNMWVGDILLISTCPVHTVVKGDNCETIQYGHCRF